MQYRTLGKTNISASAVALGTWFARIPAFELTDPAAVTWSRGQVRGARTVPVVFWGTGLGRHDRPAPSRVAA